MMFESAALPPVSKARTWIVAVVAPEASAGTIAAKSYGNETSFDTICPLTMSWTLRTCTSSVIATWTGMELPSTTWNPAVPGSASTTGLVIETVGARPWLSNDR